MDMSSAVRQLLQWEFGYKKVQASLVEDIAANNICKEIKWIR